MDKCSYCGSLNMWGTLGQEYCGDCFPQGASMCERCQEYAPHTLPATIDDLNAPRWCDDCRKEGE